MASSPHRDRLVGGLGIALSVAILFAVFASLDRQATLKAFEAAPKGVAFWLALVASYTVSPASEWIILRRLWRVPASAFLPLLQKQVANDLVFGYSGDAHFYLWARRKVSFEAAPFATLRDMAVLSALAGNIATLLLMACAFPVLPGVLTGAMTHAFVSSAGVIVITSLAIFALRSSALLFSLPTRALWGIFAVHMVRIVLSLVFTAWLWSLLVPGITLTWLFVLATLRMMLSRLPILPGKDVLFAGATLLLVGSHGPIVSAVALVASLRLAGHLIVGVISAGRALQET